MSAPVIAPEPLLSGAFTKACVLLLLTESPGHGYEVLDRLRKFGIANVDGARLYPLLRRIEEDGLVRSRWETSGQGPPRRVYRVTAKGTRWLDSYLDEVDGAMKMLRRYRALHRSIRS